MEEENKPIIPEPRSGSTNHWLISGSENMIVILSGTIYFDYIASASVQDYMFVSSYISQFYLFVIATNVGYLKRFGGL